MTSDQKRGLAAIVISAVILFFWQAYFGPTQRPPAPKVEKPVETMVKDVSPKKVLVAEKYDHKLVHQISGDVKYTVGSDFTLGEIEGIGDTLSFKQIAGSDFPFKVQVLNMNNTYQDLKVTFAKEGARLIGYAEDLDIRISFGEWKEGKLPLTLNSSRPYRYRIIFRSQPEDLENNRYRQFIYLKEGVERENVGETINDEGKIKWSGIDHRYHIFNFVFSEKLGTKITADKQNLKVDLVTPTNVLAGYIVFTKKNYDKLKSLGDNLELAVDFGVFGILAVPIFRGLQFFYNWIPNYGWAIVLLTLAIRMLTFPLQYKSFKSMKKMQEIQPEINKIKEKYKDDPQRMQKETMELFKRAGANPLGGCLPLLIQMPIFFAFYKVLYEAVELVGAPWIIWVQDLSQKDPYYILPVVMALSMFLQQKLTPTTTTDPLQKKVMLFMPIIFGFIMKDLPSGLTLYIFVSTIFGIAQQMVVYRTTE
jgi:YidC/Oxa1 family membrane protein insertase